MPDRIFAFHRLDLDTARQLADQFERDGGRRPLVNVVDPVMHHYAQTQGMDEVQLLALPDCDLLHGVSARALAATRLVHAAVDEALAGLVPEAQGAGWLGHWLRHFHIAAFGYRNVGRALASRVGGDTVHLLVPDQPHRFGFHSFLPALIVGTALREAGTAPRLYRSQAPGRDSMLLPDALHDDPRAVARPSGDPVDLICHLPTCFYDQALFTAEVRASGLKALVLPSQLYDVATEGLPRSRLATPQQLMERLSPAQQNALAEALDRVGEVLVRHVEPLLGGAGPAQRQVRAMQDACRDNALVFFALESRFGQRKPGTLLISNHDTGQHGAMLSFARRHGLRTLVLPHSKVFNVPILGAGHGLHCLAHPMQGGAVFDLDGNPVTTSVLDFEEPVQVSATPPAPLARLGIVLNGLAMHAICIVDLQLYLQGLEALLQWCAAHGVDCRIRCRPNESVASTLVDRLGLSAEALQSDQQGSLLDFAKDCDLVVGYDQPTSGAIELLRQGLPMLQALCRRLAPEEWRIVDGRVLPLLPVAAVLARLDEFHADPLALWVFRRTQSSHYVAAGREARPLRFWLGSSA